MRTPRPAARTMALVGVTDIRNSRIVVLGRRRAYHGDWSRLSVGDAIAVRHDGCATGMSSWSDFRGGRRAAPVGPLLLLAGLEEIHGDLVAIDPGQFAAAVGQ